ncbi:cytochrome c [Flavobacterium sp. UMI-01]|uniref:c-type cytochrome n=1 Tax=Flavobacterium sp. UMI-01 TaxID=1441053 RepID=UPI001C7E1C20|nr:cytochrome c [Flavobacterium sp. UMI-01]GIZ08228.1 hypothetical protein FUMI01_09550 [Flavobacterium sp. UMI-01]
MSNSINILLFSFLGFVLSLPAFQTTAPTEYSEIKRSQPKKNPLEESIGRGKDIYMDFCIQCHLATGKGDGANIPPLDGSDWLIKKRTESLHAVKFGQNGPIVVNQKKYTNTMPPMGLSDDEIADVMNYVMNSWSNKQTKMVTPEEVAQIKP